MTVYAMFISIAGFREYGAKISRLITVTALDSFHPT